MTIRKTVTLVEEINSEYGAPASPPLRRVAIAAVFENPLAGKAAGADLKPLIDYSIELGASLTKTALADARRKPGAAARLHQGGAGRHRRRPRAWRRDDPSEARHGDARARSNAVASSFPATPRSARPAPTVDLIYGPLDDGWDLDAFDSTPVLIHDAPRPNEIVLWIGYATARASTPGARVRIRRRSTRSSHPSPKVSRGRPARPAGGSGGSLSIDFIVVFLRRRLGAPAPTLPAERPCPASRTKPALPPHETISRNPRNRPETEGAYSVMQRRGV